MSQYITDRTELDFNFRYPDLSDPKFSELRRLANIVVSPEANELQKAKTIIGYAHGLFGHDSDNEPSAFEPVTIIKEAQAGKSFRCVEYSFLATALLWAYGIPARMVGLKTSDVETREYGAGHVVLEFWSDALQKWIMSDVQAGVLALLDGTYSSALELGEALHQNGSVSYIPVRGSRFGSDGMFASEGEYSAWVQEYLYFYDTAIEQMFNKIDLAKQQIAMLVPVGVKSPKMFQNMFTMNALYTHSVLDFYPKYTP